MEEVKDDLVRRKDVLDMICYQLCTSFNNCQANYSCYRTVSVGYLKSATEWIPVKERLPENEQKSYWVCTADGWQGVCRWTNNQFGLGENNSFTWHFLDLPQYSNGVVAWQELPKPYKGKEYDGTDRDTGGD